MLVLKGKDNVNLFLKSLSGGIYDNVNLFLKSLSGGIYLISSVLLISSCDGFR